MADTLCGNWPGTKFSCPLDGLREVRHSYNMTTRLSSKGQIVIPQPVRERHQLRPGDDLILFELSNGDIVLRHARVPKRSLVWHLRRLQGLGLKRSRERVREVAW